MGKSTHFIGQPLYSQVIKLLDKEKILEISRKNGGEPILFCYHKILYVTILSICKSKRAEQQ